MDLGKLLLEELKGIRQALEQEDDEAAGQAPSLGEREGIKKPAGTMWKPAPEIGGSHHSRERFAPLPGRPHQQDRDKGSSKDIENLLKIARLFI